MNDTHPHPHQPHSTPDPGPRLDRLERQTHALADEVLELAQAVSPRKPPTTDWGPVNPDDWVWVDMTPDQARVRLAHLQDWMVRVLVHHPRVTVVLHPCWHRHPAVVQMLLDTCRSWEHAYRDNLDTPHLSLTWWQRDLPQLEREVARELGHCTSVRHDPDHIPIPLVDPARALDTP